MRFIRSSVSLLLLIFVFLISSASPTHAQTNSWSQNHKFPRVAIDWLANSRDVFKNNSNYPGKTNLDILSSIHVPILQANSQYWTNLSNGTPITPNGTPLIDYLKSQNPQSKIIGYFWGTFSEILNNPIQFSEAHKLYRDTVQAVNDNNWWFYTINSPWSNNRIRAPGSPYPEQSICGPNGCSYYTVNLSDTPNSPGQPLYNDWVANLLANNINTSKLDGLMFDNADLHPCWLLGPNPDWNKNNISDFQESISNGQGFVWSDKQFSDGLIKIFTFLRSRFPENFLLGGNNSWYPDNLSNQNPYYTPYQNSMDFVRTELWPSATGYFSTPTQCFGDRPSLNGRTIAERNWDYAMKTYLHWDRLGKIYFVGLGDLSNGGYDNSDPWGDIDFYQSLRYQIASALMANGYVNLGAEGGSLDYYDYFAVNLQNGRAEPNPSNIGYLGNPIEDAKEINPTTGQKGGKIKDIVAQNINEDLSSKIYRRDFENGIALINPTRNSVNIKLDDNVVYRKIQGRDPGNCSLQSSDCAIGNTITLAPYDGVILLNAPGIINEPAPGEVTATPILNQSPPPSASINPSPTPIKTIITVTANSPQSVNLSDNATLSLSGAFSNITLTFKPQSPNTSFSVKKDVEPEVVASQVNNYTVVFTDPAPGSTFQVLGTNVELILSLTDNTIPDSQVITLSVTNPSATPTPGSLLQQVIPTLTSPAGLFFAVLLLFALDFFVKPEKIL